MFKDYSINDFNNELASLNPAPGGGTVSALLAELGSSLGLMVINLTKSNEDLFTEAVIALENRQLEFLTLMDKDTEAFNDVMKAFKMPKITEDEKLLRSNYIQKAYVKALEVPLQTAEAAFDMYKYLELVAFNGNKNAISDIGVATLSIQAAIEGAVLNVKINASSIKDKAYVENVLNRCTTIVKEGRMFRDKIIAFVESNI